MQAYPYTVFNSQLIEKVGDIGTVLGEFLDSQTTVIQANLRKKFVDIEAQLLDNVLNAFITLEGTKRPLRKDQVHISEMTPEQLDFCLDQLERARILRFEEGVFELAHDTLALHISSKRSVDEVAFLEVIKMVKDRHSLFESTNTYLNASEFQLFRNFEDRLRKENSFSAEEWEYIRKSQKAIRRRRFAWGGAALSIILLLAAFSFYSFLQGARAQESESQALAAQKQAEEALSLFAAEQERNAQVQYNEHLAKGRVLMGQSAYALATQEFEIALEFKEDGEEASALKAQCEQLTGNKARFEQLIREGDSYYSQGDEFLVNAMERYQAARGLQYDNVLADSKITTIRGKLEGAFDKFMKNGDTFFKAGGFDYALQNYEKALRIKPENSLLKEQINVCRRKLDE